MIFQRAFRGREIPSRFLGKMDKLAKGDFVLGCGNLMRSDFDHSNLFEAKNNIVKVLKIDKNQITMAFVYIQHEVKNFYSSNDYSY